MGEQRSDGKRPARQRWIHRGMSNSCGGSWHAAAIPAIGAGEAADIVETHTHLAHHLMRPASSDLANAKGLLHHEVMNGVGAAEIEPDPAHPG
jgi:hypothetical protein